MKCPNCGEEMGEEKLYCEHCGEDIHIVPDFEPELERSMELTMNGIAEELYEESPFDFDEGELYETDKEKSGEMEDAGKECEEYPKKKRWYLKALLVFAIVLLLAGSAALWAVYNYHSEEYLLNRAAQYVAAEKYDKAIACYNRAIELDSGNIQLLFELADVYLLKNNKVEYEYLLREIIKNNNATIEQLDSAYSKLIAIYSARGDYQTINDLLLSSQNDTLLSTYQGYIAREPEFSVMEGYYTSVQPLRLTVVGTGTIYYTMDGSMPTENSAKYMAPIILENGDYIISAYFVNDRGVSSGIVSKEYHVDNDDILPPEINAMSGLYYFPFNIEVLEDTKDVYYTTDGTDPTYNSIPYSGAIPMPLGKSTFKFARVVDGVSGTIAERDYELIMNTDLTPEQAVASVVEYSMEKGRIWDTEGHYDESGNRYQYLYQYVTNIMDIDDFYVISEALKGEDGSLTRTGNNFAVNAYTGKIFKLQQDKNGSLVLTEAETEQNSLEEGE